MADLPEEAIDEILLRLPVKSILRFQSVSKAWRSLISASDFAKRHLQQPQTQARSRILFPYDGGVESVNAHSCGDGGSDREGVNLDYPSDSSTRINKVLHCSGLLCLVDSSDNLVLWNPSTRKLNRLPNPSLNLQRGCFEFGFGFGYGRSGDDYKIISLHCPWEQGFSAEIDAFGLKTREWRRVVEIHPRSIPINGVTFHNGLFYWLAWEGPDPTPAIISFDLEGEKLRLVARLPSRAAKFNVCVVGGRLSVICYLHGWYEASVGLWAVHEESGRGWWTSFSNFPQNLPLLHWHSTLKTDGKDLMLITNPTGLIMHNLKTGKNQIIGYLRSLKPEPIFYTETLISPHASI